MKKFSLILFVAVAAIMGVSTTGCSDDTPEPKTTTTDTTDNGGGGEETFTNSVTVGLQGYEIVTEAARTNCSYSPSKDQSAIIVFGTDADAGDIDFQITFDGKATGTYSSQSMGAENVIFALGTGTEGDVRRQEHEASTTNLTVVVTEYGEVGEKVKGTFSGQVKNTSGQTINITKGVFEVTRKEDI